LIPKQCGNAVGGRRHCSSAIPSRYQTFQLVRRWLNLLNQLLIERLDLIWLIANGIGFSAIAMVDVALACGPCSNEISRNQGKEEGCPI